MKRAGLAAVGFLLLLTMPWTVSAQEMKVEVLEVGWWSNRPFAVAQPEQGFEVAAGTTGETQSVAALRLSMPAGAISSLEVILDETAGFTEFGVLRMCPTADVWKAANPGAFDDAPTPDCTAGVSLTRTLEGFWLGDISALAPDGGEVSVMVVPVYQPPVPVGPGMLVTIGAGEFKASGTPGAGSTDTTIDTGSPIDAPADDFFVPSDAGSFGVGSQEFTPSFGPTETTLAPTDPADPTVTEDQDFALDPIANEGETKPWGRLILLIPLCAAFGVGGAYLRRYLDERGLLPG